MQAGVQMVGSGMLGGCPAAVRVDTASGDTLFLVNRDVMPRLAYGEQLFILAHELGHRLLMTSSETEADAFALGLTAGRQRRSLKSAVRAVASMEAVPVARLRALYNLCLQTDRQQKQQRLMKKQHIFDDDGLFRAAATAAPAAEEPAPAPQPKRSLNDLLGKEDNSLASQFQHSHIDDLSKAISLNDKFFLL